ncbi:beta-L-arabinofuranosidase domain-containing protein, partial [Segatella sp.]
MKRLISAVLLSAAVVVPTMAKNAKTLGNGYPFTQVPFTSVKISQNTFWGARLKAAREVTVPLAFSKCESEHRYKNFDMAAYTLQHPNHPGLDTKEWDVSKFMGFSFDDTDVYKTIEGASYILQTYPNKKLKAYIDSVLDVVAAAQEPDGYLYTARTINPKHPHQWSGNKRWVKDEEASHELYNLGHMVDAACAHYQATGSTKFLNIAKRYADCVVKEVGPKPGQTTIVPGHQIAEMALARLYTLTGEKKYLDEAKYLLDYRGKTHIRNPYSQSQAPILEQKEAVGHAVRAGYMYAGIADVAALTKDSAYMKVIDRIF